MDALVGLADLEARAGEGEQALELSMRVLSHPSSTQAAKDRAEHLRVQLEPQLSPQQIEAVRAGAQGKSFDDMVKELLSASP